jgi:hypothetical protein
VYPKIFISHSWADSEKSNLYIMSKACI